MKPMPQAAAIVTNIKNAEVDSFDSLLNEVAVDSAKLSERCMQKKDRRKSEFAAVFLIIV